MFSSSFFKKRIYKPIKRIKARLKRFKHVDIYLFVFSFLLIFLFKIFQFPSLTINAEMFSENGTNFFYHAYNTDLLKNLITSDAGYLPLIQRFAALIIIKIFGVIELYPLITQLIAISFIAFVSAIINLRIFKFLHEDSLVRFMLGISIGLISDYELNAFINFVYYGALVLFLFILVNKEKLNNATLLIFAIFSSLLILSKGHLIAFVPIYLFFAIKHFRKRELKSLFFCLAIIFSGFLQFIYMLMHFSPADSKMSFIFIPYYFIKAIYYYIQTYKHVFFGYLNKEGISLLLIGIIAGLILYGLFKLKKSRDKKTIQIFIAANFIAFCSLFITTVLINNNINPRVLHFVNSVTGAKNPTSINIEQANINQEIVAESGIFDVKHFANLRSLFISNLLIFLSGLIVILSIFPKKEHKLIVLIILILTSGAFGQIKVEENYPNSNESYSQWKIYHKLLSNNSYCIPINHYPFLLTKNCDYLYYKDPNLIIKTSYVKEIDLTKISKPDWKLKAVVLIDNKNINANLSAFNKGGEEIARAKLITPKENKYSYYLFEKPIAEADSLRNNVKDGYLSNNFIIYGTGKKVFIR